MSRKEIHEDFMETFWKKYPSYSTMKRRTAYFRRGERALRIMNGLASPPLISSLCIPWLCVIEGKTFEA